MHRKHVVTLIKRGPLANTISEGGCGNCRVSCQSACKTSCTVSNQACENDNRR